MRFNITPEQSRKAKIPHEVLLTNLIGNHVLWFVAALGVSGTFWVPIALVPLVSVLVLGYILWRAERSKREDDWYVMCHWQITARRSRVFIIMLAILGVVVLMGWASYTYLGMREVAVLAITGGVGVLPVMVTVLVLIIMESDALHHASQYRLSKGVVATYPPPPDMEQLPDPSDQGDSEDTAPTTGTAAG